MSNNNEHVEFSLFGPGVGECIVIKLHEDKWIIIDSCRNPKSRKPVALEYLAERNVDVSTDVALVVVSHWHDDHIRGLSDIIKECTSAQVAFSAALLESEFVELVYALADKDSIVDYTNSGLKEIANVIQHINSTLDETGKWNLNLVTSDSRIYNNGSDEVWSLSPSPASFSQSLLNFKKLLDKQKNNRKIVTTPEQNDCSVALYVATNKGNMLLGSDLEEVNNPNCGWQAIVNSKNRPTNKAKIFKVAHHGSQTGHLDAVWTNMLENDVFAALTTFNRCHLPKTADIQRLKNLTNNLYCTTVPKAKAPKLDKITKKLTEGIILEREVLNEEVGHIRFLMDKNGGIIVGGNSLSSKL